MSNVHITELLGDTNKSSWKKTTKTTYKQRPSATSSFQEEHTDLTDSLYEVHGYLNYKQSKHYNNFNYNVAKLSLFVSKSTLFTKK